MPLTKATVTAASRIMLPTYVALTAAFGIVYLFDPFGRVAGVHALAAPRYVMGGQMWPWGVLFLGLSVVMLAAFMQRRRAWFVFALYACEVTFGMWAVMYAASVVIDPATSLLAPVLPLLVIQNCRATVKSLMRGER